MTLQEILKQKKTQEEIARMDIGNDIRSYNLKIAKVRRAKEDLETLFEEYKTELMNRCFFILSCGENRDEFNVLASEYGCYTKDMTEVAGRVAGEISEDWHGRERFNPTMVDACNDILTDIAYEVGIQSMPQLVFDNKWSVDVSTKEKFRDVLNKIILEKIGGEFLGYYTMHHASKEFFQEDYDSKYIPIIISCEKEFCDNLRKDLAIITPHIFVVETKETVDSKGVEKTLKAIRKNLK